MQAKTKISRRDQVNAIEATNSRDKIERWDLYKAESGLWVLRDETGMEIEFETTLHKSKQAMQRCLQNRGLTAKI